MNGHEAAALLDTGSEVTSVTETLAAARLKKISLQQAFLKLRAVNGAEVPYAGILLVDIDIWGEKASRCSSPSRQRTHPAVHAEP